VVDEQGKGAKKPKKFRIKIWDKTTGRTIYDNNLGYPDDVSPTTEVSGGNIDIRTKHG
jgi:phospholipase C